MAQTHIVIIGAGFAGMAACKELQKQPNVKITIIDPQDHSLFTPLLHEFATGILPLASIAPKIRELAAANVSHLTAKAIRIDTEKKEVETDSSAVPYDKLILATGAGSHFFGVEGAETHSFTFKTIADAEKIRKRTDELLKEKDIKRISIIGGGPTGVELAAALAEYVKGSNISLQLIQGGETLVPSYTAKNQDAAKRALEQLGIDVQLQQRVIKIQKHLLHLKEGKALKTDLTIWVAGVNPRSIPLSCEPQTERGKIHVNDFLQVKEAPNVYVAGDVAHCQFHGSALPATAQVAEAQGSYAGRHIVKTMLGLPLPAFTYRHKGSLVSFGFWNAGFEKKPQAATGVLISLLWHGIYLMKLSGIGRKKKTLESWIRHALSPGDKIPPTK